MRSLRNPTILVVGFRTKIIVLNPTYSTYPLPPPPSRKNVRDGGGVYWDEAVRSAHKSSSLGFAVKYAAQLMDEILTPIPIDLQSLKPES